MKDRGWESGNEMYGLTDIDRIRVNPGIPSALAPVLITSCPEKRTPTQLKLPCFLLLR